MEMFFIIDIIYNHLDMGVSDYVPEKNPHRKAAIPHCRIEGEPLLFISATWNYVVFW